MKGSHKLFIYSMNVTPQQCERLTRLTGKPAAAIKIAAIENAADIIEGDTGWQKNFRDILANNGYQLEQVDLRQWLDHEKELEKKLSEKDVIWLGGGNTYYLRWILKRSGADKIINRLTARGTVFSGWSAGAIMAGPTTRFFNHMGDDPSLAPEEINEGLCLTDIVVVPHRDHPDFKNGAIKTNELLKAAGYNPVLLGDSEVLVIDGGQYSIL